MLLLMQSQAGFYHRKTITEPPRIVRDDQAEDEEWLMMWFTFMQRYYAKSE